MTPKQREAVERIHLYGCADLSGIAGQVLHTCCRKGWIEIDEAAPFPYGHTAIECEWVVTEEGKKALADE